MLLLLLLLHYLYSHYLILCDVESRSLQIIRAQRSGWERRSGRGGKTSKGHADDKRSEGGSENTKQADAIWHDAHGQNNEAKATCKIMR